MPMYAHMERPVTVLVDSEPVFAVVQSQELEGGVFDTASVVTQITAVEHKGFKYQLRTPRRAMYLPSRKRFEVHGFSPFFIGRGDSEKSARDDWAVAVHAEFQRLLGMRFFEMEDVDRMRWDALSTLIDVPAYRNSQPVVVQEFGRITKARPYPEQITWDSGARDNVSIADVNSADFVTYKVGQPVKALVSRDPRTFKLLKIMHIERVSPPHRLSAQQEKELLQRLGSAGKLKESEW